MTAVDSTSAVLPPSQIAELIASLVKALRAFQMYLPNNPIHQRASQNVQAGFAPIWAATDEITLTVAETDFLWEDQVVYHQLSKPESLAWTLYKDGLRVLTFKKGVEQEEIGQFLELVNRARFLTTDAPDDLLTLLWEREFQWVTYIFAEPFTDTTPVVASTSAPAAVQPEERRQAVEEEAPARTGGVDLDDFDGTLYFLDESEINYVIDAVRSEYSRDSRSSALAILYDLYEMERAPAVRAEILDILDSLFPNLLNQGEFRVVASVLREFRVLEERAPDLTPEQGERVREFEARLSEPSIVRQLVQSLDEASTRPGDEDVRDVLGELRSAALGPVLGMLPRLYSGTVRTMLEETVDRLASQNSAEVLRLLRGDDGVIEPEALPALVGVCGRLRLQGAVTGLGDLLGSDDAALRLAAVQALDAIGTPGALAHLDRALDDADRAVRVAAVKAVGARGYRSALRRVENVVQGKSLKELDMSEKKAFFEAYGAIAGASGIKLLAAMLEGRGLLRMKESPEVRACAALALGRIGTTEARDVLQRAENDKELVVRNAVKQALREAAS